MYKSKRAAKSALIIMIFTLGSKFLGFIRETLIAAKFGAGEETDAFLVALTATGIIGGLISSAINNTFIPVLLEIEVKKGKPGKIKHTNNMINSIFLISLSLVLFGWLTSPFLIKLLAKGFYGRQYKLAVNLTKIGMPQLLFYGLIGVLTGYLNSEQMHVSSAAIGFPFNFTYILYLLLLSKSFGIKGLMITTVIAVVSQLLILLPGAKKAGFRYELVINLKDQYIKKVLYMSFPIFISVALNDLNAIVDRTLASTLVSGSISALNYANRLNSLVLSVFIYAIVTVIFPILSKEKSNNNIREMKEIISNGVTIILLITIPATVGLVVLATPIVQVAFQRGEFDKIATIMTSRALIFYSLGLVSMSIRTFLDRVYYSLQDTRTPMINVAISVILNIILNLILVRPMAHAGLALATSIAVTVTTFFMFYGLRKKIGSLGTHSYLRCGLKAGIASIIMGMLVFILYHRLYRIFRMSKLCNLISLLFAGGTGIVSYVILCCLFGIKEVKEIVINGRDKIINFWPKILK